MRNNKFILATIVSLFVLFACSKTKSEVASPDTTVEQKAKSPLIIGDTVPNYLGVDENNQAVNTADHKGQKIVLYFYPKDESPGCTTQSCNLRDNYDNLTSLGYIVFGVSTDSVNSHKEFIANHKLPFSLIADVDTTLIKQFGAISNGRPTRTTFIINESGVIEEIIDPSQVNVTDHTLQILNLNN